MYFHSPRVCSQRVSSTLTIPSLSERTVFFQASAFVRTLRVMLSVLRWLELKRKRSSDKVRRFERASAMQLWQSDITSFVLTRHSQRVYLTVYIDDHSLYIVAWSLQLRQKSDLVMDSLLMGNRSSGLVTTGRCTRTNR